MVDPPSERAREDPKVAHDQGLEQQAQEVEVGEQGVRAGAEGRGRQ